METKLDIKQIQFEAKKLKHVSVLPMFEMHIKMYNELSDYLMIDNSNKFEQGSLEHSIYNIGLHMENVNESIINLISTLNRINEYKEEYIETTEEREVREYEEDSAKGVLF